MYAVESVHTGANLHMSMAEGWGAFVSLEVGGRDKIGLGLPQNKYDTATWQLNNRKRKKRGGGGGSWM